MNYLNKERLEEIVKRYKGISLLVIGDIILDKYIWGNVKRISPEAPVPVVEVKEETENLGGSANVAQNCSELKSKVTLLGIIGKDSSGRNIKKILRKKKVNNTFIIESKDRPTTIKIRIMAHSQHIVRVDREEKKIIPKAEKQKLKLLIEKLIPQADAVVLSDYKKGLLDEELIKYIIKRANEKKKIIVVDPKPANFKFYKNATILTPNEKEATEAWGKIEITSENEIIELGNSIRKKLNLKALLLTRGEKGMILFEKDKYKIIPTVAKQVYDVTGAGDTVVSVLASSLAATGNFLESALIANYAAGIVVSKVGTATVTQQEIITSIK